MNPNLVHCDYTRLDESKSPSPGDLVSRRAQMLVMLLCVCMCVKHCETILCLGDKFTEPIPPASTKMAAPRNILLGGTVESAEAFDNQAPRQWNMPGNMVKHLVNPGNADRGLRNTWLPFDILCLCVGEENPVMNQPRWVRG